MKLEEKQEGKEGESERDPTRSLAARAESPPIAPQREIGFPSSSVPSAQGSAYYTPLNTRVGEGWALPKNHTLLSLMPTVPTSKDGGWV